MKRLQRSRIAAACLALLLFFSATAALAEDAPMELAPGVTWNTTPTDMMALEGITDLDDAETYSHGDYIQYGFMPDEDGNENDDEVMLPYIYYVFHGDRLMMYGISYASFFLPEDADLGHLFNLQESIFYVKYGAPTIDDPQRFVRLMDVMEEGVVTAKDLNRFMGWELANGTELFLTDGEFGILRVYTNTAELLDE